MSLINIINNSFNKSPNKEIKENLTEKELDALILENTNKLISIKTKYDEVKNNWKALREDMESLSLYDRINCGEDIKEQFQKAIDDLKIDYRDTKATLDTYKAQKNKLLLEDTLSEDPIIDESEEITNHLQDIIDTSDIYEVFKYLYNKLVPKSGPANTVAGEIIRALMVIINGALRNKQVFYDGEGKDKFGSAFYYLTSKGYTDILEDAIGLTGDDYISIIEKAIDKIARDFIYNPELLKTQNMEDYTQFTPIIQENNNPLIESEEDIEKPLDKSDTTTSTEEWAPKGDYKYLGRGKGFDVYKVNDYIAYINLGINTGWYTTGRYTHYGDFVPSEKDAKRAFEEYTSKGMKLYYFLDPKTHYGEYALEVYPKYISVDNETPDTYIKATNFDLYNSKNKLDYSAINKLPLNLIDSKIDIYEIPYNNGLAIKDNILYNCKPTNKLKDIIIPNGVTTIKSRAFYNCYKLTNIIIPDSVKKIGRNAFANCSLKSIVIGKGITTIDDDVFYNCANLKSIIIPNNVTSIGKYAFSDCSSLTSVTISDRIVSIGDFAFSGCKKLTNITIPDSLTSIGRATFSYCIGLKNITIGNKLTSLGDAVFQNCLSLKSIDYKGTKEEWNNINSGDWTFQSSIKIIHCTDGDIDLQLSEKYSTKNIKNKEGSSNMKFLKESSNKDDKLTKINILYRDAIDYGINAESLDKIFYSNGSDPDYQNLLHAPTFDRGLDVDKAYEELSDFLRKKYQPAFDRDYNDNEIPYDSYNILGFNRLAYKLELERLNKEIANLKDEYNINENKKELTNMRFLKESLTKSDRDIILDVVKGKYETGHGYLEDKRDYEEALGRRLTDAKYEQLEEFYSDLMDLGPEGFYEEYKDMLDFDPDFIAEYGYSEDDEEEDELEESLKEDLAVNGEETLVDTANEPAVKPAVIIIKVESSLSADGFEVTVKDTAGNIIDQQSFRYGYNASYSKLGVDKYKPFVTDIINRYLSKYNLNKDNIIVTKGRNVFKGTDVSDEDITDFKNNYLGSHLDESKDESLKEGYLDNIKNPDYWQHQVDYQLEHFGRVGGGLIQDLDEAGFYLDADNKVVKKLHEDTIKDPKIKWTFIKSKEVEDSDGFLTDYTWYEGSDGTQVMVFGDNDIYKPEDGYFDITFTDRKQAEDWFNSY